MLCHLHDRPMSCRWHSPAMQVTWLLRQMPQGVWPTAMCNLVRLGLVLWERVRLTRHPLGLLAKATPPGPPHPLHR